MRDFWFRVYGLGFRVEMRDKAASLDPGVPPACEAEAMASGERVWARHCAGSGLAQLAGLPACRHSMRSAGGG